ncbi:MAG: RNA polymerase subunit sigma-70 [Chloroflexales bacterium]
MTESSCPTDEVIRCCEGERNAFLAGGTYTSPCCVELFRRAFAGDQDAWAAVDNTFHSLIHAWVRNVLGAYGDPNLLDEETRAEVVQSAKRALSIGGPRSPGLTAGNDLAPILAFWRTCTKREILMEFRRRKSRPTQQVLDPFIVAPPSSHSDPELRIVLQERLAMLLISDEEQRVFDLLFFQGFKPAEIARLHPDIFPGGAAHVSTVAQRIRRRCWKDPIMRDLAGLDPEGAASDNPTNGQDDRGSGGAAGSRRKPRGPASLEIQTEGIEQAEPFMGNPCELDESLLFDYIAGLVSAEQRAAVETNAACLARVQMIATEVAKIEAFLYRAICPEPDQLIAYQERRLEGTLALVVMHHVERCERCREELAMLAAIDTVPLESTGPLTGLRRAIEAMLQPTLALKLRGKANIYLADQVLITLSLRQSTSSSPRWTLTGELSHPDGGSYTGSVEYVLLQRETMADIQSDLDADGTFVFRNLQSGSYRLTVVTVDTEVMIRLLSVGSDDDA